ncbi:hypothetical protein GDO86_005662 [Hymenochirus boettgeri]|uniref:Kit ligand n=1 Tax=Hymenochirus boettgeri TaxID=247094 RepID=A0A8T2J5D8_9PIPI|nr:hypothetical protein GDO86_005662 [Hymenochirus boettgeri]
MKKTKVGNLPNDYIMTLRYVPKKESLPKHCWLYIMVNEMTRRLDILSSKFKKSSQNYLILDNLSLILHGIRFCIKHMDFDPDYSLYEEQGFTPEQFFKYVNKTIEVFKEINNTEYDSTCDHTDYNYEQNTEYDSMMHNTNQDLPYVPSSRRNSSRIVSSDKPEFKSGAPLQWTSVVSIALACLLIGFVLGIVCWWKFKHREVHMENDIPVVKVDDNESKNRMLQKTENAVAVI